MATNDTLCLSPYLDRLNYFYGQMLGVRDFQTEQNYFREKIKLHNRCLHGYGVVCGLEVSPGDPPSTAAAGHPTVKPDPQAIKVCWPIVTVACGLALDAAGNELIVHAPLCVDLERCFSKEDLARIAKIGPSKPVHCWVSLSFRAMPMEPVRPVVQEGCGDSRSCQFGRLRDSVCVNATLEKPKDDYDCNSCCEPNPGAGAAGDCCNSKGPPVFLARITFYGNESKKTEIDNRERVRVGHHATTITDINWVHGGVYSCAQASRLIQKGLVVRFSREIRDEWIRLGLEDNVKDKVLPGIMDVFVYMGGGSISGDVKHLMGEVKLWRDKSNNNQACGLKYNFRDSKRERLSPGDRLQIVVRSAFILDKCCRPIDGLHVGGWVPLTSKEAMAGQDNHPDERIKPNDDCAALQGTFGRWESGTGSPGGNFESWITVTDSKDGENQS